MVQRVLVSLTLFFSLCAFAESGNVLVLKPEVQRGDLNNPQGLWPFLGVGLGLMDHNEGIRTGGVPSHFKILGSYYFDETPWVAAAGIGLHKQFLNQNDS